MYMNYSKVNNPFEDNPIVTRIVSKYVEDTWKTLDAIYLDCIKIGMRSDWLTTCHQIDHMFSNRTNRKSVLEALRLVRDLKKKMVFKTLQGED
jgi:hypothetical protein